MADNMDNGRDADKTEYETASDINGADISTDAPVNEAAEQSAKFSGHRADPSRYAEYEDDADFDDPLADDADDGYDASESQKAHSGQDTYGSRGAGNFDDPLTDNSNVRNAEKQTDTDDIDDTFPQDTGDGEINDPLAEEMGDTSDEDDGKSGKNGKPGKSGKKGFLSNKGDDADDGASGKKKGLFGLGGKRRGFKVVRVEDIKKQDYNYNQEDVHDVLSTYIPVRRAKLIGRALLRMDRMRLFLLGALLLIALLFILAFMQEKMGNFTINLDRLELFRKGIAMSADPEFTTPTARLTAAHVEDATNISIDDIPADVADVDGDHNGRNYMAYTYYVRNAGKEDVDYIARVTLNAKSKGAEEAVRVAVWRDDERTVYAWPSKTGEPEKGCVNFESDKVVCTFEEDDFKVGYVNKYTVVIWMEGDDPECVDKIIGGSVEFTMDIAAADKDNTTLIAKYIQDIKDSLSGDRSISAAGTEAPDYFKYQDVNWYTRRNRPGYEEETTSTTEE